MGTWAVELHAAVDDWFMRLVKDDPETADLIEQAVDMLLEEGPGLGRPLVDRIKGSRYHNMKELRPAPAGRTEVRILFAFDPWRKAILLTAGDKAGNWKSWYTTNIPLADKRYTEHLAEKEGGAMARSWQEIKADKAAHDKAGGRDMTTARTDARTATKAYVLGFRLAELRAETGLSQTEIAGRMGITQPRVSQLENGDVGQMEVATLSRYVLALGGQLKLVADLGGRDVTIEG